MYTHNSPAVKLLCRILNGECDLNHIISWIRNPLNNPTQDFDILFEYGGSQVRSDFVRLFLLVLKLATKNKIKEERKKTPLFKFEDNVSHKENLNIKPATPTETVKTSESTYDTNFPSLSNVHPRKNKRFSKNSNSIPDCSMSSKNQKSGFSKKCYKNSPKELSPGSPTLSSQSDSPLKETNIHGGIPACRVKCVEESPISSVLNEFIFIYKEILDCRLCVSIAQELAFLLNILFNKELTLPPLRSVFSKSCLTLINGLKIFKSKDECYTFATNIISAQLSILKYVDPNCVKSISKFYVRNIDLADKLMELTRIYDDRDSIDDLSSLEVCERILKNVHISSEEHTSNCNNTILLLDYFDSFLSSWNNKTVITPDIFKSKVSSLIEMTNQNTGSLALLAERFVKHLIKHAQFKDRAYDLDQDSNYLEKLAQLQKRFVQPCGYTNLEEFQPHEFNHAESFFSDFISCSFNLSASLILYIKQSLIFTFNQIRSNLEENGVSPNPQENSWYLTSIKIMQCLGKYLGLIEFFPFKSLDDSSTETKKIQIKLRSQVQPPMPFLEILKWACESGFLILIVPWITNYLLLMDSIAFELPYIKDLLIPLMSLKCCANIKFVNYIDKVVIFPIIASELCNSIALIFKMSENTAFFLSVMIEQIFTTSHAIESKYFELLDMGTYHFTVQDLTNSAIFTLDKSNIINRKIILETCHKFKNLKFIPTTTSRYNYCSDTTVRRVTPSSVNLSPEQALIELESSFYSGYKGLNAVIDFLASQTSQVGQKRITDILFRYEKTRSSIISQHLQSKKTDTFDAELIHKINQSLRVSYIEIKEVIGKEIQNIKDNKLLPAFRLLQGTELPESAELSAEKLLCKKFDIILDNWVKRNIPTIDDILKLSFRDEKTHKAQDSKTSINMDNVQIVPSLVKIQDVVDLIFLEDKMNLTTDELIALLNATLTDAIECNDSEPILLALYVVSWDLLWGLVTCLPHLITKEFILGLTKFWLVIKSNAQDAESEKRLLCPRNIRMALLSPHKQKIPRIVAMIFECLVSSKLITLGELEDQSLSLFRSPWTTEQLQFITQLFDEVKLIVPKCTNEGNTGLLLDWMHETSHQLDDYY